MQPTTLLLSLLAITSAVFAVSAKHKAAPADARSLASRHNHRSHAHAVRQAQPQSAAKNTRTMKKRQSKKKRCIAKSTSTGAAYSSTAVATPTSTASGADATSTGDSSSDSGNNSTSTGTQGPTGGIITVQDSACGPNGAVNPTTETAGPNGSLDWLDCGINNAGGWSPPTLTLDDIVYTSLDVALQDPNSPFQACASLLDTFKTVAQAEGIPDILLAAFASQESSCNPQETGGGGEVGLFQLSEDKCPNGTADSSCYDPTTNTQLAAQFIKSQLDGSGGNLVLLIGNYNGWFAGMTYADATAAATGGCCRCQNNLDYIHQFLNGWMQNVDAYSVKLGKYFNLDVCGASDANGRKRGITSRVGVVPRTLVNTPTGGWRF